MDTAFFFTLLAKILPLYMNIGLGYIAGKVLNACRESIGRIMFYMINPIIIFNGVLNVSLDASVLTLPLLTFGLGSLLCLFFYMLSKGLWEDSSKNLMAYSAGTGNAGYFGLPVALLTLSNEGEGIYVLLLLGMTLYENSLGYYIMAKGSLPANECMKKLIQLPAIYAFAAGLFLNYFNVPIPAFFSDFMGHIRGTYAVLGMMIIGLGLAALPHFNIDTRYVGMAFLAKFFAWPAAVLAINAIDIEFFGFYTPEIHKALLLIAIVPIGVNTTILATILNSKPEKAASAVLLSTFFALVYVPIMIAYFI